MKPVAAGAAVASIDRVGSSMPYAAGGPRRLVGLLVAVAVLLGPLAAASPASAAPRWSCLPSRGMLNDNPPAQVMAGTVVLTHGERVRIGTTGDVAWAQPQLKSESARFFTSLRWLESLVREYQRTKDPALIERARAIARDFARDNPPGGGPRPADTWTAMYAGVRTTVLACLDSVAPDPAVGRAIAGHAGWLAAPANDPGDWNQGIDAGLGLLAAGCWLDRPAWRTTAAGRFGRLIEVNIDVEGAINEQAPGYGGFVHDRWGMVAAALTSCGQPVPRTIAARRPLLLEFIAWATQPDGNLVQIGDTYQVRGPSVPGTATEYVTTAGARGAAPRETSRIYQAGYVFGRDTWSPFAKGMHYSLRFGPRRDFHGHEDHQSITLAAFGRPVLVDSGHVGYDNDARRAHLRGPEAHNVLLVPGEKFLPRRPTELVRSDQRPTWQFYEVRNDAYGGRARTRGLLADTARSTLLVQDRASRAAPGRFEQLWHVPRGAKVTVHWRDRAIVRDPGGAFETHLLQVPLPGQKLPVGATSVVSGQTEPLLGWVAPGAGTWQAAPVVRMARTGTSVRMVTAIVPVPVGTKVTAGARWDGKQWQVQVTAGGSRRSYVVSPGGYMWVRG